MMVKKKLFVWTMPESWSHPLLAAWRTFEAALNPAFSFLIKCNKCGKIGATHVDFVVVKHRTIGLQCECGQTLKFLKPLNHTDPDFPTRLRDKPESSLTDPTGKEGRTDKRQDDVILILFGGDDA